MSRSLSNLAKKRALNLTHGLRIVIHQLHHVVPDTVGSHQHQATYGNNPSGLIDKIYSRLTCIDDDQLSLASAVPTPDGLMDGGTYAYNHRPLLSFLEETLDNLESKGTHSIVEFMRFYNSFQHRLLSMRGSF
jgi:hypothetical protein